MCSVAYSFAVVDDGLIPHCFLIGAQFISANQLVLDICICFGLCCQDNVNVPLLPGGVSGTNIQHLSVQRVPLERLATVPVSGVEGSFSLHEDDFMHIPSVCLVLHEVKQLFSEGVMEVRPENQRKFELHRRDLSVVNDYLMRGQGDCKAPVGFLQFLVGALACIYENNGPKGRRKLIHKDRKLVWHPEILRVAQDIRVSCGGCQFMKVAGQIVVPPTLMISTTAPFQLLQGNLLSLSKVER